jgi:hypothetical protein
MIKEGTKVEWSWGNGTAEGEVTKVFTSEVSKTIDGNEVTREASEDCPAYLIKQEDGQQVIKSKTEVKRKN